MKHTTWLLSAVIVAALAPIATAAPAPVSEPASTSELAVYTPLPPVVVIAAESRAHIDGLRVAFHAAESQIARRDLLTARFDLARTRDIWDRAVANGHPVPAGYWAQQHAAALVAEREAMGRWMDERAERDLAARDFRSDRDVLRRFRVARELANQRS